MVGVVEVIGFVMIEYVECMFSFDNVFFVDEFCEWVVKIRVVFGCEVVWLIELKIDGFVINLWYENGVLILVVMCGDGCVGEIVIENVLWLLEIFV